MSDKSDIDFAKLIPELPTWNNGRGISVDEWIGCSGNFELAIGYSRLFWPGFVEHDGCVFFADFSLDSYRGFRAQHKGDRRSLEEVMNHRHIFDHFSHVDGVATEAQILYLGGVLQDIWRTKLARDFPGRTFVVHFSRGPFLDIHDYEVTFWQGSAADLLGI